MADMRLSGRKNAFSTVEIAKALGLHPWRVRRSLKSNTSDPFSLVWAEDGDKWNIDRKYVRLHSIVKKGEPHEED